MDLKVESATYQFIDKVPCLKLQINGLEAVIGDVKHTLLEMGYVALASGNKETDWSKLLPSIDLPATEEHHEVHLEGFTSDPIVVQLAKDYWSAINWQDGKKFKEGPVDIPKK